MATVGFAALERRVKLTGWIETQTALHIGTGRSLSVTGSHLPVVKAWNGDPMVPGSSLRGALRSQIEGLVRGLNAEGDYSLRCAAAGGEPCDLVAERYCVKPGDWDRKRQNGETEADWIARILDESAGACHVCRLFGAPYVASKVLVSDLAVLPEYWHPRLYQVRDGIAIDRETLTVSQGKKFDFEVVPAGVRFELSLVVDNPEKWELGLLLAGIRLFNEDLAFLGGQSSRGTGRIRIEVTDWEERSPRDVLRQRQAAAGTPGGKGAPPAPAPAGTNQVSAKIAAAEQALQEKLASGKEG